MSEPNVKQELKNVIEVKGLGKEFNNVWVLKDVDFELRPGEIHSLVGENGAGKSTFIKMLSGIFQPSEGSVFVNGQATYFNDVRHSEAAGIRTVHQEINLVPSFSVYENIFIGSEYETKIGGLKIMDDKKMKQRAREVIKELGIDFNVNKSAQLLNASMKRIVEICKVLVHQPKVVIFDEPTTSLGEEERKRLLNIIMSLKKKGLSIIYVSHNLEEVTSISDRITVFRDGRKIDTIKGSDASIGIIISMMLGNKTYNSYQRGDSYKCEDICLELENVYTDKLKNVSFKLHKGEVLGIAGVVGAGKTEIAQAIFGLDKISKGKIKAFGKDYTPTPQNAIKSGIALVPEERQAQGLIPNYCVKKNITLTYLEKWCNWGVMNNKGEIKTADEYIHRLSIKTTGYSQLTKFLSGGNQQKVILARWLNGDFKVGIFDEPTKGIDIKAKEDIYLLMTNLAMQGRGIILLSSYLPELLSTCDRIIVVREGEIINEINPKQPEAEERIMAAMLGGELNGKNF